MTEMRPLTSWRIVQALGKQRYLCLSLLAFLFALPLAGDEPGARLTTQLVLVFVFITGPLAVARTRATLWITGVFAIVVFVMGIGSVLGGGDWFLGTSALVGFVFFGFLSWLVTRELLFDVKEVTAETLWAAVNVYVLIGLSFAFLYSVLRDPHDPRVRGYHAEQYLCRHPDLPGGVGRPAVRGDHDRSAGGAVHLIAEVASGNG
jgi:hypothetical protein